MLGHHRAVNRHRLDLRLSILNPLWQIRNRNVRARRNSQELISRCFERLRRCHEFIIKLRFSRMLRSLHDRDSVNEHGRSARRNHITHRNPCSLLKRRDIRHVPKSDNPFLSADLLIEKCWIQNVFACVRVEFLQPIVSSLCVSSPCDRPRDDRAEYRSHCSRRNRVANQKLPFPLWIEHVVPVLRRLSRSHCLSVVCDDFRREIRSVPVIMVLARFYRNGVRPCWDVWLQKIFACRSVECFCRRTEPDIRLRIVLFRPHAVEHFLRTHVDPLHVDVRVRFLKSLFEILEQLLAVWRVDDQNCALVARATESRQQQQ